MKLGAELAQLAYERCELDRPPKEGVRCPVCLNLFAEYFIHPDGERYRCSCMFGWVTLAQVRQQISEGYGDKSSRETILDPDLRGREQLEHEQQE